MDGPYNIGFDIVCCRNVLLHMTIKGKKKALSSLKNGVKVGGILILGDTDPHIFENNWERNKHKNATVTAFCTFSAFWVGNTNIFCIFCILGDSCLMAQRAHCFGPGLRVRKNAENAEHLCFSMEPCRKLKKSAIS